MRRRCDQASLNPRGATTTLGPGRILRHAPSIAANDGPDINLIEAHNPIRDASAVSAVENLLLPDQLTHHQQLVVPMAACSKKAATASDQGINAGRISHEMAQLLLNRIADLVDAGSLLRGHGQKLQPGLLSMGMQLITKAFSDLRMLCINRFIGDLPDLIERREICWVTDIGGHACSVNQQCALDWRMVSQRQAALVVHCWPSRKADDPLCACIRHGPEVADQIEIECSSGTFGHREKAIPPA